MVPAFRNPHSMVPSALGSGAQIAYSVVGLPVSNCGKVYIQPTLSLPVDFLALITIKHQDKMIVYSLRKSDEQ